MLTLLWLYFYREHSQRTWRSFPTCPSHSWEPCCHLPSGSRPAQIPNQLLPSLWCQPLPPPWKSHQPSGVVVHIVLQWKGSTAQCPDPLLCPTGCESLSLCGCMMNKQQSKLLTTDRIGNITLFDNGNYNVIFKISVRFINVSTLTWTVYRLISCQWQN